MELREVVRLRLRERACARVKLFVLGKGDDYLHISIPPSTRTRKTGGRQLHTASKGPRSILAFPAFVSPPPRPPRSCVLPRYSAREGDSFSALTHPSSTHSRALEVTADWSIARNRHRSLLLPLSISTPRSPSLPGLPIIPQRQPVSFIHSA